MIRDYLDGICARSPQKARPGHDEFGSEVHAYSEADFDELLPLYDAIDFNSSA